MTTSEFIQVLLLFLTIFLTSSMFGLKIISLFRKILRQKEGKTVPIEIMGAGFLVGIGIFAYLALILGIAGVFNKTAIYLTVAVCLGISLKEIVPFYKSTLTHITVLISEYKKNLPAFLAIILTVLTLGSLYLSAMQPPYSSDELHYHLPEVKEIVETHIVKLDFGGHPFYGNIPKLMEIVFAIGKTLSSYQLSHALNFAILIGFIFVIFGFVKKHYGLTAASFSILFLAWFDDFTWNATTGYIDAATAAIEISALLFAIEWLVVYKDRVFLFISAVLIGIAVSMKYSPLPSALFILALVVLEVIKTGRAKKILKTATPYLLISIFVGGFWYIKNLVKFGNPFYPLYLGHAGYPEDQYKSLIEAIQQFGPKTPSNFFELTKHYLSPTQGFVFLSIYLSPLVLLVKKSRRINLILFSFFIINTAYWFLVATHQIRFLASALVVSIILLSILISKLSNKLLLVLITIAALLLLYNRSAWTSFWKTKFHFTERQYGLGNVTRSQFLTWRFGCQYSVIKYVEENNLKGNVIDNWSVWFAPSVSFYAVKNNFQSFSSPNPFSVTSLKEGLNKGNVNYIYLNTDTKGRFLASEDPIVIENKKLKLPAETYLLKTAKLVFQDDSCLLYKITE